MLHIQTAVVNNPKFIELQHTTLKYFIEGDYDFTVFNDAKDWPDFSNFGDPSIRREIERTCERLNIPCVSLDNARHKHDVCAAHRCADSNNAMLEIQRRHGGKYLVLDSDMFPIAKFNTNKYNEYAAAIVPQIRENDGKKVHYFWNGIYYFNMDSMTHKNALSWKCDDIEGVWTDVGGGMHYYLQATKDAHYTIRHLSSGRWSALDFPLNCDTKWLHYIKNDVRNTGTQFYSEIYDNTFLHFRAGGNWDKRASDEYESRVDLLSRVANSICH